MTPFIVIICIVGVLLLGIVIVPLINRRQFNRLPRDQKIRILMKQAKGLVYFKNLSDGRTGSLIYIKNKRKIYVYPWELQGDRMVCTRDDLFKSWDYPEEMPEFSEDERIQALEELEKYNNKNRIKLYLDYGD